MRTAKTFFSLLAFAAALALSSGCASMGGDDSSNLPWTQVQPWEGAPGIPGFSQ